MNNDSNIRKRKLNTETSYTCTNHCIRDFNLRKRNIVHYQDFNTLSEYIDHSNICNTNITKKTIKDSDMTYKENKEVT